MIELIRHSHYKALSNVRHCAKLVVDPHSTCSLIPKGTGERVSWLILPSEKMQGFRIQCLPSQKCGYIHVIFKSAWPMWSNTSVQRERASRTITAGLHCKGGFNKQWPGPSRHYEFSRHSFHPRSTGCRDHSPDKLPKRFKAFPLNVKWWWL